VLTTLFLDVYARRNERLEGFQQLFPQLRMIAVDVDLYASSPDGFFDSILPRLLVVVPFPKFHERPSTPDAYHLRLSGFYLIEEMDPALVTELKLFTNRLSRNLWPRLRSIHLEDWLEPDLEDDGDLGEVAEALLEAARKLDVVCAEKKIQLVYDDERDEAFNVRPSKWLLDHVESGSSKGKDS